MSRLPTKHELREWIAAHPGQTAKRDIAKAFGIKGAARIDLKRLLRELQAEGHIEKRRHSYRDPDKLPPVSVLEVSGRNADGDLTARALEWRGEGPEPVVDILPRAPDPDLEPGDRILARLTPVEGQGQRYTARLIRRIGMNPRRVLGVFRKGAEGGRILPIDKKSDVEWLVPPAGQHGAQDGELVEAEQSGPRGRIGLPQAHILKRLGDPGAPKAISLIAIHQSGMPTEFSDAALNEADAAVLPDLRGREDLRDLPLITIDPADARDRDDAVHAEADTDPANPGGHVIWVAIADVAAFVTPGSALDEDARTRGNSTYFPDRVVPMLPDRLSGDLCSLHEGVERACIAARMVIDAQGTLTGHSFHRGLMRSRASLAYEAAQAGFDGATSPVDLGPMVAAYKALKRARAARQPLELDLPERQIVLNEAGKVISVAEKPRLDAHMLIEEFMVLANVAAARTLIAKRIPLLFRVHEPPDPAKMDALRETAEAVGLSLAKGQVIRTAELNRLLARAAQTDDAELINISTLRAMSQAYYSPENLGHFGLALQAYAHFTSPIRRYADLIVHRALITAHGWGDDGLTAADIDPLAQTAEHISSTERRSTAAERDTVARYLAAYLAERAGSEFTGRISGVARFGLFVTLDETGADGLVPIRTIGAEHYHFDRDRQSLLGSDSGLLIQLGQRVTVRLRDADANTGGMTLELLEIDGASLPKAGSKRQGFSRGKGRHRGATSKSGGAKRARKVTRRRSQKH